MRWHGHNRWGGNCIAHTRSHYWLEISQSCSGRGTYLGWWYHRLTKEHENTTISGTLTWCKSPSHLWFEEWLVRDKQPTENWLLGVIHGTKPKSPQMCCTPYFTLAWRPTVKRRIYALKILFLWKMLLVSNQTFMILRKVLRWCSCPHHIAPPSGYIKAWYVSYLLQVYHGMWCKW
jgi:hypothetical protein